MAETTSVKPIPGRNKFKKIVDFGSTLDFERTIRYLYAADPAADGGIQAMPVFLVDPNQKGESPIKPATILLDGVVDPQTTPGTFVQTLIGRRFITAGTAVTGAQENAFVGNDLSLAGNRIVSAPNTAVTFNWDARNLNKALDISMSTSAGLASVTVSVSTDNVSYIDIDVIAAAGATNKHYADTTVGATLGVSPLAFRYIKIVIGAAGLGNTTTTLVSMK